MFKRILVPLDGSPRAERALPVAGRLARASGGTLLLVRVVSAPNADEGIVMPRSMWTSGLAGRRHIAAQYLARVADDDALTDVAVETDVVSGAEAPALLAVARSRQADALVLCGQGMADRGRWGLGAVARMVIHDAHLPVLAVPEDGEPFAAPNRPARAIVALDGSALAEAAIAPAAHFVAMLDSRGRSALHLMHIAKDATAYEDARYYLGSLAHELRVGALAGQPLMLTWSVTRSDDIIRALIAQANPSHAARDVGVRIGIEHRPDYGLDEEQEHDGEIDAMSLGGADLIAISTHGYAGLYRGAIGPVAEAVLRLATCPVLVVPPLLNASFAAVGYMPIAALN